MKNNVEDHRKWLTSTTNNIDPRRMPSHTGAQSIGSSRLDQQNQPVTMTFSHPMSQYSPDLEQSNKVRSIKKMITNRGINQQRSISLAPPEKILSEKRKNDPNKFKKKPTSSQQPWQPPQVQVPVQLQPLSGGRDGPSPGGASSSSSSASSSTLRPVPAQLLTTSNSTRKQVNKLFESQPDQEEEEDVFDDDDDDDLLMKISMEPSKPKLSNGFVKASSLQQQQKQKQQKQKQQQQQQHHQQHHQQNDGPEPPEDYEDFVMAQSSRNQQTTSSKSKPQKKRHSIVVVDDDNDDFFDDDDDDELLMNIDMNKINEQRAPPPKTGQSSTSSSSYASSSSNNFNNTSASASSSSSSFPSSSNRTKQDLQNEIDTLQRKLKQDQAAVMNMSMNGTIPPTSITQRIKTTTQEIEKLKLVIHNKIVQRPKNVIQNDINNVKNQLDALQSKQTCFYFDVIVLLFYGTFFFFF